MVGLQLISAATEHPDIIYSLEDDQVADSRLSEHVAIEPGQRVRPKAVKQQPVPANALIEDARVTGGHFTKQTACKVVWPAVVSVGGRTVPVSDRISQRDNGRRAGWCDHVHAGDVKPMVECLCAGEVGV